MKAPAVFNTVCRNFIQDLEFVSSSPEGTIDFATQNLQTEDLRELIGFLGELLGGRYTQDELQELWWSTPADIHFRDGKQLVAFLSLMKERVGRRLG